MVLITKRYNQTQYERRICGWKLNQKLNNTLSEDWWFVVDPTYYRDIQLKPMEFIDGKNFIFLNNLLTILKLPFCFIVYRIFHGFE